MRHSLFNSGSKNFSDHKSMSNLGKNSIRVALQEQLRGHHQTNTESKQSLISLAQSFKARNLRKDDGITTAPEAYVDQSEFENFEIHKSYSRLRALKFSENAAIEQKLNGVELALQVAKVEIFDVLAKRVPPHWHQFLDDANQELS